MKFTNKKRGFTIVELIIVIAVIAVLAAVLIPVFSGLIQQGKDAEAKVVVNTLNKGLAMTTTKPATMQSALEAVETNVGINVAKLDETYAKTGNKILWDSEYNTFLFVTKDGEKVSAPNVDKFTDKEINLWAVAKTTDDLKDNYSHYWYGGDVAAVEVATGFDAGVASINAITYKTDATQSVVIRTNSEKTELTINAKNSDVQHYDVAGNVKVLAVKGASYHEHGNVIGTVTVESGHVQIESGAEVASIIASKSASETVAASVTAASGATVGTVVVNHASASVEVKSGATVAEVAPGKDVTIDTSKVTGITPSTTVIDTEKASDFAGGLGTEVSPYLIANAEQFENINKLSDSISSGNSYCFKQIANINANTIIRSFAGSYNGNGHTINVVNISTWYLFYQMKGATTIENLVIEMGQHAVSLMKEADWNTAYGATFRNITFNSTAAMTTVNQNNFGFVISEALYTCKSDSDILYVFDTIINNVDLQNEGTCTGFLVGSGPCFNGKTIINVVNCVNNANIYGTTRVGYIYGNSAYIDSVAESNSEINLSNSKNNGALMTLLDSGIVAITPEYDSTNTNENYKMLGGSFVSENYLSNKSFTIHQKENAFTISTNDNSVVYKLAFNVDAIYSTISGKEWSENDINLIKNKENYDTIWTVSNGTKFLIDLSVDNGETGTVTKNIRALDRKSANQLGVTVDSFDNSGFAIVVKDGTTYIVLNTSIDDYCDCNVSLILYAYRNGSLMGIKKI